MIGYGVFEGNFSVFASITEGESVQQIHEAWFPRGRSGPKTSAIAILVLFVLSRLQLGAQYLRVAIRRGKASGRLDRSHMISAGLPILAATLWLASLFVLDNVVGKAGVFAPRTALWLGGIMIEMVGTYVMRLHKTAGFAKTHLTERFGSLTIIILGEGVIKLVSVLRDISSGVGFEVRSGIAIASSIFSFYLIWALYFSDANVHDVHPVKAYSWAFAHYLFHLGLVVLLEDITSLLLFTNLYGGINALLDPDRASETLVQLLHPTSDTVTLGRLTFRYSRLTTRMTHPDGSELRASEYDYAFLSLLPSLFRAYNLEPAETFVAHLHTLAPDAVTAKTMAHALALLFAAFVTSARVFLAAAGLVLLALTPLLAWRAPISDGADGDVAKRRRGWRATLRRTLPAGVRLALGLAFVVAAVPVDAAGDRLGGALTSGALIPAFCAAAGVVYLVDHLAARSRQA